ncbi:MAG: division/cell wall cluster transcriptional repressor MraZ [Chloroflexota bacterium]|nr:division/cell wall cluster transcriptional repressor MraZ [Chloroflexota bacterium]
MLQVVQRGVKWGEVVFLGNYEVRVDHKGRLAIPTKFREAFHDGLVLSCGFDKCLIMYTITEWKNIAEKYSSLPMTQRNPRMLALFTFSGAFDLELDRQGRIIIPPALRQYADINDEVIIAASNTNLQIWAKESWVVMKQYMAEHAAEIAEAVEV